MTIVYMTSAETVHAGIIDRIKDIYQAPDKIDEIKQQYTEANEALSEELAQSRLATEQLAQRQTELIEQNKALLEQNASLQTEIEQARQREQAFRDKLVTGVIFLGAGLLAYFMAVRVWRYLLWRKHRNLNEVGGGIGG